MKSFSRRAVKYFNALPHQVCSATSLARSCSLPTSRRLNIQLLQILIHVGQRSILRVFILCVTFPAVLFRRTHLTSDEVVYSDLLAGASFLVE